MNILITSIGRRTYMIDYFLKSLNGQGKVFAGNSEETYALFQANGYIITPSIYDPTYIDTILKYCIDNSISAVISLFDIDLPILARNKDLFKSYGIKLLISDYDFVEMCNDKWATYKFIINNNLLAPKTYLSLHKVKEDLNNKAITFPLILKPRWGMGSIGIYQADNELELDVFYNKVKKDILFSYLKYESVQNIDESIIIQEKIIGEEWGIDIFNDLERRYLVSVPKQKLAMRAGETDIAIISKRSDLINLAKKVSSITKHIGNLDMDFFISNEKLYILELNCRFGGQYPFSHQAGVNFPNAIISMLRGETVRQQDLGFEECKVFKDFEIRRI